MSDYIMPVILAMGLPHWDDEDLAKSEELIVSSPIDPKLKFQVVHSLRELYGEVQVAKIDDLDEELVGLLEEPAEASELHPWKKVALLTLINLIVGGGFIFWGKIVYSAISSLLA